MPCYNAEATVGAALAALARQCWDQPWEVIVVDNRSTDASRRIVEGFYGRIPGLRVLSASERQSNPYALNVGLAAVRGEWVAICDADDEVGEGWLPAIAAALEQHAIVGARVDAERLNQGWVLRSRGNNQHSGPQPYRYPPYLPHLGGNSLALHRTLLVALGGFDERFPRLFDTSLCWLAQLCGFRLYVAPAAVVHVRYRQTLGAIFRQARGYAEDNVALYRRFRPYGMPPVTLAMSAGAWWGLLPRLARVRDKGTLAGWVWYAAQRVGRLQGCVKYRVLAL